MPDPVECLNLSSRYETRLLAGHITSEAAIPAVVISGFLGSGKTTLVQHLLRNRGALRIAVLIDEFSVVDVDSLILNLKQSNAAVGLAATDLSGGCICCAKQGELQAALQDIRSPATAGTPCPDYLVLETSGVADPEALALALSSGGFRLDAIVTVVDAEAATEMLKQEVAQRQVQVADVVVINKCDLVTLGQVADVEDAIQLMVPGVRSVRARYGQVPLPAILDVDLDVSPHLGTGMAAPASITSSSIPIQPAGPTAASSSSEGFLSHEASVAAGPSYRVSGTSNGGLMGSFAAATQRRKVPRVEAAAAAAAAATHYRWSQQFQRGT